VGWVVSLSTFDLSTKRLIPLCYSLYSEFHRTFFFESLYLNRTQKEDHTKICFAKNQLFPCLISLSLQTKNPLSLFLQTWVQSSYVFYYIFNLFLVRSQGFGFILSHTCRFHWKIGRNTSKFSETCLRFAFTFLNLWDKITRRSIMQKVHHSYSL